MAKLQIKSEKLTPFWEIFFDYVPCLSRVAVVVLHLLLVGVRRMMKMVGSLPTVVHRWLIPCASLNHAAEVFTDKSMTIWLSEKAR